jgi:hypothetical protein
MIDSVVPVGPVLHLIGIGRRHAKEGGRYIPAVVRRRR